MTRTLLVGYGAFGSIYARRVLEHADFDLVGVVDNRRALDELQSVGVPVWREMRAAIEETRPELVVIATHEEMHEVLCVEALARGCHVMTAKPGAMSLVEAERLVRDAQLHDRRLIVDWTPRYMHGWATLMESAAELGTIQTVRFSRRGWATPRPCGALWDLAPHDVALAISLDSDDAIIDVTAAAWGTGVHLGLSHASGKVSRVECDYTSTHRDRSVEIVGTSGYAEWLADEPIVTSSLWAEPVRVADLPDAISKHLSRVARVLRGDEDDDQTMLVQVCRVLDAADNELRARAAMRARTRSLAVAA